MVKRDPRPDYVGGAHVTYMAIITPKDAHLQYVVVVSETSLEKKEGSVSLGLEQCLWPRDVRACQFLHAIISY